MTRMNALLATALGCIATAGLAAQTPGSAQPTRDSATSATTVTGCVERADQLGSTGAQSATVDSQHFMLIRAQPGSVKEDSVATGTAGTLGPMYRLIVDAGKINPHVGHKVEITGTVEKAANAPASSTASSPSTAPAFKVQSIKMLSETCGR
jgi:hypothetical protein